ncbi:MAG TPA: sugar phosphate isomerase/epimerase [archaeon]|nr:sugar phosphate isomerase/epimerase [archaeon]
MTNPTIDVLKEIETIAKLGFDFVEIGIEWPEGTEDRLHEKRRKIIDLLGRYKLFSIGHTAWWIDFSSPYEQVRKAWIEESKKKIQVANILGIKRINFHTHATGMSPFHRKYHKQIMNNFLRSMKELSNFIKKYDMMMILENAAERGEITDFDDYKYIITKIPEVKVHLDVGHAFINGGMESIKSFITTFGNRIEHIHLHDNHGEYDEHLPIGNGKIDFPKVVRMLKKIGYSKTITFEVFTSKKDAVKSREKIKKLWKKI